MEDNFENKCKTVYKHIFDKIKENRKKTDIEFIKFILSEHQPNTNPLRVNQTVETAWMINKKKFLFRLSVIYNPDNYPIRTEEEKLKNYIMKAITCEINEILSGCEFEKIKYGD